MLKPTFNFKLDKNTQLSWSSLYSSNTRRGTQSFIIVVSLLLSLSACRFQTFRHSPTKAAFDTNEFLKALYFDDDCVKALKLADAQLRRSATADDLRKMVDITKQERGALKVLRADSYLMSQGETMELFYIGEYENGILYHRLVLLGDASAGYRVTGVWFQAEPYAQNQLRRKFDVDIPVS